MFPVGMVSIGCAVRSSRMIRAVTWTDSDFSAARTLYTLDLIDAAFFLSDIEDAEEAKSEELLSLVVICPFGDESLGEAAKKDDLR